MRKRSLNSRIMREPKPYKQTSIHKFTGLTNSMREVAPVSTSAVKGDNSSNVKMARVVSLVNFFNLCENSSGASLIE